MRLGDTQHGGLIADVLSESEQRGLALACFLAELKTAPVAGTVILDDPASSADPRRRELLARRLAALARDRQVIVLTHGMWFLYELAAACDHAGSTFTTQHLERRAGFSGWVSADPPFMLKKIPSRINSLLHERLTALKKAHDSSGEEYRRRLVAFCVDLRATLERVIEQKVFNGVVTRFQKGVKLGALRSVPIPDQLKALILEVTAVSQHLHDCSLEAGATLPPPHVVEAQVQALESILKSLKDVKAKEIVAIDPSHELIGASDQEERAEIPGCLAVQNGTAVSRLEGDKFRRAIEQVERLSVLLEPLEAMPNSPQSWLDYRAQMGELPFAQIWHPVGRASVFASSEEHMEAILDPERRAGSPPVWFSTEGGEPSATDIQVWELPQREALERALRDLAATLGDDGFQESLYPDGRIQRLLFPPTSLSLETETGCVPLRTVLELPRAVQGAPVE